VLCAANTGRQFLLHELLLCWHKELASSSTPTTAPPAAPGQGEDAKTAAAAAAAASASAAVAGAKRHAKLVAFLLLVQHLSGFYKTEQQRFRQGLAATLRASAADDDDATCSYADAAAAEGSTAALPKSKARKRASDGRSRSQQLQLNDSNPQHDQQSNQLAAVDQGTATDMIGSKPNPGSAAFDYMLGEEERQRLEEPTAKFTSGLLEETAPACYLPLLLQLLAGAEVPTHIKVGMPNPASTCSKFLECCVSGLGSH
jgi:hypothetical protein